MPVEPSYDSESSIRPQAPRSLKEPQKGCLNGRRVERDAANVCFKSCRELLQSLGFVDDEFTSAIKGKFFDTLAAQNLPFTTENVVVLALSKLFASDVRNASENIYATLRSSSISSDKKGELAGALTALVQREDLKPEAYLKVLESFSFILDDSDIASDKKGELVDVLLAFASRENLDYKVRLSLICNFTRVFESKDVDISIKRELVTSLMMFAQRTDLKVGVIVDLVESFSAALNSESVQDSIRKVFATALLKLMMQYFLKQHEDEVDECGVIKETLDQEGLGIRVNQHGYNIDGWDKINEALEYIGITEEQRISMFNGNELIAYMKKEIKELRDGIEEDIHVNNQINAWLDFTCCFLSTFPVPKGQWEVLSKVTFFKKVNEYRNPQMRYVLTALMLKDICSGSVVIPAEAEGLEVEGVASPSIADSSADLITDLGSSILEDLSNPLVGSTDLCESLKESEPKSPAGIDGGSGLLDRYIKYVGTNKSNVLIFAAVFLVLLEHQGVGIGECLDLFNGYIKNDDYKFNDNRRKGILINTLYALLKENKLRAKDKTYILNVVKNDNPDIMIRNLNAVYMILQTGNVKKLEQEVLQANDCNLEGLFPDVFKESFAVGDIDKLFDKYKATIAKFRDKTALVNYRAVVNNLPEPDRSDMIKELTAFVRSVLLGNFPEERYSTSNNEHLQIVFKGRKSPEIEWRRGAEYSIDEFIHYKPVNYFEFLRDQAWVSEYGILNPLYENLSNVEEPKARLESKMLLVQEKIKELAKLISKKAGQRDLIDQMKERSVELSKIKLELYCLRLCDNGESLDVKLGLLKDIKTILKRLKVREESIESINSEIRVANPAALSKYEKWKVVDSDDPQDLFLCSTEIDGSCQSFTSGMDQNKGLLGYVMNGQNRLIAVKDREGKIRARRLLRLLWDRDNGTSVLFLEDLYTAGSVDKKVEDAVLEMAKRRAKALGLILLSKAEEGELYSGHVESLGGRAPYDYTDAGNHALDPGGRFDIKGSRIIPQDDELTI